MALALLLPVLPLQGAFAARDPLAEAEARVTAARRAANEAAVRFEEAQTRYYALQEDIERTRETVAALERDAAGIALLAQERAIEAYRRAGRELDSIISGDDVLEAMRRNELLDRVNAQGNDAVDRLGALTEDLRVQEQALAQQVAEQERIVGDLRAREAELRQTLRAAERAEAELRERLARERRQREAEERIRRARAAAAARSSSGGAVLARPAGGGGTTVSGLFCPVPGSSFGDSWGAPRSGGRRHQGVDMMAGYGTPIYAVVSGTVSHGRSGLGGNQIWLHGSDGHRYFYAHLQNFVGPAGSVSKGDQIGTVGDTGNARGTPHLHFEIHPGGGRAVNPYPSVRAAC
jgi:murein DD-endopeptidase MepM/ murein hydrolase activator NlpD